ncbi:MAG TPA: fumarylacetoacetate hydrolase family protein [Pyrinomonadaceae bacterium]|nr:fumarylacetoacetate hydrolase family protein [Pyrinomonadaceae bacterium]
MKLVCFNPKNVSHSGERRYRVGAMVDGEQIADLTPSILPMGLSSSEVLRCYDLATNFVEPAMEAVNSGQLPLVDIGDVKIEAPVPRPNKIICIGLNYLDHVTESGAEIPKAPLIFSKFDTCVAASEDPILLPVGSEQVDFEAELAVVIGRRAKNIDGKDAMDYVFGYTNFNDVSARDMQFADGQWQRGKSCDTFAPFGEYVATKDEIADPHNLRIRFRLNGETMQDSNTDQLIFKIPALVEYLSRSITLEPGDIIATGTPPGVGFARKPPVFLKDGDVCEVEIEGLGVLINPVVSNL